MKCPHCDVAIHTALQSKRLATDHTGVWGAAYCTCPACNSIIIYIGVSNVFADDVPMIPEKSRLLVYPKGTGRPPLPALIPTQYAADYNEGALVLSDSPKASAALSRRCLQHLIHDELNVKLANLSQEIQAVLDSNRLPSHLADSIDAIRNIGNFAAHPTKNTNTGEIVDVEPGEAEWLLDVLDGMFDFLFIQPAATKARRAALDQKLAQAKKPPMT